MIFNNRKGGGYKLYIAMSFLFIMAVAIVIAETGILSIEKEEYVLGEVVEIKINATDFSNKSLKILTNNKLYKFPGNLQPVINFPTIEEGEHVVTVEDINNQEVLGTDSFNVITTTELGTQSVAETTASIEPSKDVYEVGESIDVRIKGSGLENHRLLLIMDDKKLLFRGELKATISFQTPGPGDYKVELRDPSNNIVSEARFSIIVPQENEELVDVLPVDEIFTQEQPVQNLTGDEPVNFTIYDSIKRKNRPQFNFKRKAGQAIRKGEIHDLEVIPDRKLGKRLFIRDLQIKDNMDVGMEEVPFQKLERREGRMRKAYAINMENLNFTNATFTETATGNELWKCKDWNFTTQTCFGNWVKLMDITPGQDYNILLTPGDPGFVEILVTAAMHLDENRTFISDIFNEVSERDDVWSEEISENHYVRVTFEKNLSSLKDITIYPRTVSGSPRIEIYEVNESVIIAEFTSINDNQYNRVLLSNLVGLQDTFDLRILNGSVEFDHIIDPTVNQVYNTTGLHNFTVPAGTTNINVKIWGAGGGGGGAHSTNAGGAGAAGGYVEANITVTPGETLDIFIGGGGGEGQGTLGAFSTGEGGGGGGVTYINRSSSPLLVAGGGGGGGGGDNSAAGVGAGGSGGNSTAEDGGDASAGTDGGGGGTQSSGGSGGASGANAGSAGGIFRGGEGGDAGSGGQGTGDANNGGTGNGGDGGTVEADFFAGGGGAGAGYFGGGGGGSSTSGEAGGGGGGGGSSFINETLTILSNLSGSGTSAPNTGDPDYQAGFGSGGAAGTSGGDGSAGGNGLLIITWNNNTPPTAPTNITCDGSSNCNITVTGSVVLNVSGSTDNEGENITFFIEALLKNITTIQNTSDINKEVGANFISTNWGDDSQQTDTTNVNSWFRCMGGTSPNTLGMVLTGIFVSSGGSGNARLSVYQGGALDDPNGAGLVWDAGTVGAGGGFVGVSGGSAALNASEVTWICVKGNDNTFNVHFAGTHDATSDFQSARGRFAASGQDVNENNAFPSSISGAGTSFGDFWYSWYFTYDDPNAVNETNSTWTTYSDMNGEYGRVRNLTVKVEADSYNPEASVQQSTNDPDLQLEIYNGTEFLRIGNFSLNATYTGSGLDTTNNNFTLTTSESTIMTAWQTPSNQDLRIRGVLSDYYNTTTIDEINYTNVWVTINGQNWTLIGNHTQSTTFTWDTSNITDQVEVDLRARAIDIDGSNTYSSYFTKGANMTLTASPPPTLNSIQCYESGSGWATCSGIQFGDTLDAVRSNCTTNNANGTVQNVSYRLRNVEDAFIYFDNVTTDNSSGFWVVNMSDVTIWDSGSFNLHVTCNENPTTESDEDWTIAWGNLTATLIDPSSNINVTSNRFFNFTSRVTCIGGECGWVNATLDPITNNVTVVYNTTGTLTIPGDVTSINVKIWGTGGGGGGAHTTNAGGAGGAGGFVEANITVTPGETLDIFIGGGGGGGQGTLGAFVTGEGGGGGGVTYINRSSTPLLVAGAGGGGGGGDNSAAGVGAGGSGGNSTAEDGGDASASTDGGGGGTQSSGGSGGASAENAGTAGDTYMGGEGGDAGSGGQGTGDANNGGTGNGGDGGTVEEDNFAGGGGGGAGYFGGGGGGSATASQAGGGGGGGGSNYLTGTLISNLSGSGTSAPNTGDPDYQAGIGSGGAAGTSGGDGSAGGNGLLVVKYTTQRKGIVPMNTGSPFYTITANPMVHFNLSCLANMTAGDSCDTTWEVNATGPVNNTWEFFVTYASQNYSVNVSDNESSHINITIKDNLVPVVSGVALTPTTPVVSDALNCSFTVTDQDVGDVVTANVSWYSSDVLVSSSVIGVTSGVSTYVLLGSGNTTIGETWHCGIRPFDGFNFGSQVNSSDVNILASLPPTIQIPQCQENGSIWDACLNITYGNNLTAVRVNCTDPDGIVVNATFNFTNLNDSNTFFFATTTDNSSGFFVYDNTDLTINDSGTFNLTVTCVDNTSTSASSFANWTLPWGVVNLSLITPATDSNVTQNRFFNFSTLVSCTGGECGNVSVNSRRSEETITGYSNTTNLLTNPGAETGDLTGWTEAQNGMIVDNQTDFTSITPNTGNWMFVGGPGTGNHIHQLFQDVDVSSYAQDIDAGLVNATTTVWLAAQSIDPSRVLFTYRNSSGIIATFDTGDHASETWTEFTNSTVIPAGTRTIRLNFTSTSGGNYDDATFDDSYISVRFPLKTTDMVTISTTGGDTPFYTTSPQPQHCVLIGGQSCNLDWNVNATGTLGTTWVIDTNATPLISAVPYNVSNNVTVTIVQNFAPAVSSVVIAPSLPIFLDNLNCTFTITDPNTFDTLSANVSWYNSSNLVLTQEVNVTNGVETTTMLGFGNTSADEIWFCGVTPYDQFLYGPQVNSSNVTILSDLPPEVRQLQCFENNSVWHDCSNLAFGDNFTGVRLNCTGPTNPIQNVTFNFTNDPDGNIFINTTTDNTGDWWNFFQNITMNNSGNFTMIAACVDNESVTVTQSVTWGIPWGTLLATLVEPSSNTDVQQNAFFTFTAQVECIIGECGNVNATLDPGFNGTSPANGTPDAGAVIHQDPDDEDGGTFTDTQVNDASYFAIGEDDDENTLSFLNLTFNISALGISPLDIQNISLNLTYCHSGENSYAEIDCNGDDPAEKTFSGTQDVWFFNYVELSYTDLGDLDTGNGENEVTDTFGPTSDFDDYVSSDNLVTIRTEIVTGPQTGDSWLAIDHALLIITYTKLKRGLISTVIGDTPFYTTDPNPKDYTNASCLGDMIAGDVCQVAWPVNATGVINSTHEFWVIYNATNNTGLVTDNETTHIFITIVDVTQVPPIVTLESPANNNVTNNPNVVFNCSATDNVNLRNMTLYSDFTGSFTANGTNLLGGTSNSTTFARTLSDGVYSWNCRADDIHGNFDFGNSNRTITVDTTNPNVTLSYPNEGDSFFTGNLDFNFTVTDNIDTTLTCDLVIDSVVEDDDFSATNGSLTSRSVSNLLQGEHFWNVTCTDDAGNTASSVTRGFNITEIPPNVTLVTPTNFSQSPTTIVLQYNATDNNNVTQSRLYINGVLNATDDTVEDGEISGYAVTGLQEGIYTWTVNVTDVSNLTAQAPERIFIIDFTSPVINLSAPANDSSTTSSTVTFNFTVTDNLDNDRILVCNITVNGAVVDTNFNANNGSLTSRPVSGISDGINNWNVTCVDDAGNLNTSENWIVNVSAPPTVVLNSPADGFSQSSTTIILIYTPTDNTAIDSCDLILDGVFNQTNSSPNNGALNNFTLTNLVEGNYNWTVTCNDTIGLNATASPVRTFIIDGQAPTVTLNNPLPNETITGPVLFNFTAIDNVDPILSCNLTIDGVFNATLSAPNGSWVNTSLSLGTDGLHLWNVTCIDDAGNINTSETRNFTTQNPPQITLTSPIAGKILNFSQNVNFSYFIFDSDGLNETELLINGQEVNNDTTPSNNNFNTIFYNFSVDGVYNWSINGTDLAGLESSSGLREITIDTTPPNVTYVTPSEDEVIAVNNVTFTFSAIDALDSTLFCNLTINDFLIYSNIPVNNGANATRYFVLADGAHNWSVSCIDHANNTNPFLETNFTVSAPPNVSLNFPLTGFRTRNQTITFNYAPLDAIGFENCSILLDGVVNSTDTAIEENIPNFFTITDIPNGDHNWTVQCIDEDLNSFTPSVENFTIDLDGPVIVLNFPTEAATLNNNNVTFNWTPTDAVGTTIVCNLTVDGTVNLTGITNTSGVDFLRLVPDLTDGDHNWSVACRDDLNNSASTFTSNFTINQPDLRTNNSQIYFSNSNPDVGENVTIFVNVTNIGGIPANDVLIEFWDGGRGTGTSLGSRTVTIGVNVTAIVNSSFNIGLGFHYINIFVDPEQNIGELDESNNNATTNITTLFANITSPPNGTLTSDNTPTINFTMRDFYNSTILNYTILVDGTPNGQTGNASDGASTVLDLTALSDGERSITVEVLDPLGRIKTSDPVVVIVDTTAPFPVFETQNQTFYNTDSPTVTFNITDAIDTNINWTIIINGVRNGTGNVSNGTSFNLQLGPFINGSYILIIEAFDDLGNIQNSTPITIFVDQIPPVPAIETANFSFFNTATPTINFNITDNLDSTLDYTIYVDGSPDVSGTVNNATSTGVALSALSDGVHVIIVQGTDSAGNAANTTSINITIDTVAPAVTLLFPGNNTNLSSTTTELNFTVTDTLDSVLVCNLTLDSSVIRTNFNANNNTIINTTVSGLNTGFHFWNATCVDNAGNSNTSVTFTFFVEAPDLEILEFTLNDTSTEEGKNLTMTANVSNTGNIETFNITVQFFLGHPNQGGTQINGNLSINNLTVGESVLLTLNHTAVVGLNALYVVVDPPIITNGTIVEANESNNIANVNFTVGHYHTVAGDTVDTLQVTDALLIRLFTWNITNATGSNVFVADTDSAVTFTTLGALGRNITNQSQIDDFEDIDSALGSAAFDDSINITWTAADLPRRTRNFTVFSVVIENVAIVNSTNTTNFLTGILWDKSDGGNEYNGTQDVVFITEMNEDKAGAFGTYDYEIRVPATLRDYISGTDTVTFYTEIK